MLKKGMVTGCNLLGVIGLVMLGLFIYLNDWAPSDSVLHEYRIRFVLVFVIAFLVHGAFLFCDSIQRKKYVWMVLLIVAPVPVYWIYYLYYVVLQLKGQGPVGSES